MTITPDNRHIYRMKVPDYGTLHCLALNVTDVPGLEDSFLAVRVTMASAQRDFPGWVRLSSGDPVPGYVVCHDIDRVGYEELSEDLGALSLETSTRVDQMLRRVLGL